MEWVTGIDPATLPPRRQGDWDFRRRSNDNRRQPFGAETIPLKHSVMRNNAQFFYAGLGNEHPIERIAVHSGQSTDRHGMPQTDRQWLEAAPDDCSL